MWDGEGSPQVPAVAGCGIATTKNPLYCGLSFRLICTLSHQGRGERYFAILHGANHFTVVHPSDPTAGRAFLDRAPLEDEDALRGVISKAVGCFLDAHLRSLPAAQEELVQCLRGPLIQSFERK